MERKFRGRMAVYSADGRKSRKCGIWCKCRLQPVDGFRKKWNKLSAIWGWRSVYSVLPAASGARVEIWL